MPLLGALNTIELSDPSNDKQQALGYEDFILDPTTTGQWCTEPVQLDFSTLEDLREANLDLLFAQADDESLQDVILMDELMELCEVNEDTLPRSTADAAGWHMVSVVNTDAEPKVCTVSVDRTGIDMMGFTEFFRGIRRPWTHSALSTTEEGDRKETSTVIIFVPPQSARGILAIRLTPPLPPGFDLSSNGLIEHLGTHVQIVDDKISKDKMNALRAQEATIARRYDAIPCIPLPLPMLKPLETDGYLITQGFGGRLTHFLPHTFYAVDIRAAIGTPILAPYDGVVESVHDNDCCATGIHVSNLYSFTSVMIKLDPCLADLMPKNLPPSPTSQPKMMSPKLLDVASTDSRRNGSIFNKYVAKGEDSEPVVKSTRRKSFSPLNVLMGDESVFVEFAHISPGSCPLKKGERFKKGQMIALVGNIGFVPEPHVHVQAYVSSQDNALPIQFHFSELDPKRSTLTMDHIQRMPALPSFLELGVVPPMAGMRLMPNMTLSEDDIRNMGHK